MATQHNTTTTTEDHAPAHGIPRPHIFHVSQDHDGQSYDGFEMTAPEIAQRIERLTAAGHRVTIEIHVDNPNDVTECEWCHEIECECM